MGYFADGFSQAADLLLHMDDATMSAIEATLVSTSWALAIAAVAAGVIVLGVRRRRARKKELEAL